jgi:hypothetical protein
MHLNDWQRINHFPNHYELTRKVTRFLDVVHKAVGLVACRQKGRGERRGGREARRKREREREREGERRTMSIHSLSLDHHSRTYVTLCLPCRIC